MPMDAGADAGADAGDVGPGDLGVEQTVFDLYETLQLAVRGSPDHRVARAAALVQAGELAAIHAFVRDEIALYPGTPSAMGDTARFGRWGWRGTLRGGGGTAREKAELLAALFSQAGHSPQVIDGRWMDGPTDARALLLREIDAPFEPALTDEMYESLLAIHTDGSPQPVPEIDSGRAESAALAQQVMTAIEQNPAVTLPSLRAFDFRLGSRVPVVRLEVDGQPTFANPVLPSAEFGRSYVLPQDEDNTAEPMLIDPVEVRLSGAVSSAPNDRLILCERTYAPDELVGRQLIVNLGDGLPLDAQAITSFGEVGAFIPAMVLQALDLDAEAAGMLSVIGEPVTLAGERFSLEPDGGLVFEGQRLAGPAGPIEDTSAVASVEVASVKAGNFPEVSVEARVFDANGSPVEGLAASAFSVLEDDQPRSFMLRRNTAQPSIIVLADESLSMPPEFRGEAGRAVTDALRMNLQQANPNALVTHENTNSDIWTNTLGASQANPTVIVYITDGDVADAPDDATRSGIAAGPPVVFLKVRDVPRPELDEMAQLSAGSVFLVADVGAAVSAVTDYVNAQALPPYLLSYQAPVEGPMTRQVRFSVPAANQSAQGSYERPAQPGKPARLCGLYLRIKIGAYEVERTLVGRPPDRTVPVSQAHLDEVQNALFGQFWVYFEGGMPSTSIWLDEQYEARLRTRALIEAALADDLEAMRAAHETGLPFIPPDPYLGIPELRADTTPELVPYEHGLRVMIYGERPVFGTDIVRRTLDLLPTSQIAVMSEGDQSTRLAQTLRVTARAAIAERALYDESTASLLQNANLSAIPVGNVTPFSGRPDVDSALQERWRSLIEQNPRSLIVVPEAAQPLAYWSIDPQTGAMLGILANASGGGDAGARMKRTIERIDAIIDYYNLLPAIAGAAGVVSPIGAVSLSIVAEYGKTLVRLYAAASLTITALDASQLDRQIRVALHALACNVIKNIFLGAVGSKGGLVDAIDKLFNLTVGSNNPFSCPSGT